MEESSERLGLGSTAVRWKWSLAKAWLRREINRRRAA